MGRRMLRYSVVSILLSYNVEITSLADKIAIINLLRPKFQIPSIFSYFVGVLFVSYLETPFQLSFLEFLAGLLVVGPLVAGGSLVINQFFDYHLDKDTGKNSPLLKMDIEKGNALKLGMGLLSFGLIIAFLINLHAFLATVAAVFISIAYHAPPIRLKGVKYLDSISNGLAYGFPPAFVGWSLIKPLSPVASLLCLPLFLGYTSGHMLLAIPDIEGDIKFNIKSTASVLGVERTALTSLCLMCGMFILVPVEVSLNLYPPLTLVTLLPAFYIFGQLVNLSKGKTNLKKAFKGLKKGCASAALLFIFSLTLTLFFTHF